MRARWVIGAALMMAGCDRPPPDPLATVPLARWRATGVPVRRLLVRGIGSVAVPRSDHLLCTDGSGAPAHASCGYWLDPATGRSLASGERGPPGQLDVDDDFAPGDRQGYRNMTRVDPDQHAGGMGTLAEGRVLAWDQGTTGDRAYAFGCWRRPEGGGSTAVHCTVFVEGSAGGSISAEFYPDQPRRGVPFTFSRARLLRLLGLLVTTDASFVRRPR